MTGRPILRDSAAGIAMVGTPAILLPKPPPQYSPIMTTSSTSMPAMAATAPRVRSVDCVEPCR